MSYRQPSRFLFVAALSLSSTLAGCAKEVLPPAADSRIGDSGTEQRVDGVGSEDGTPPDGLPADGAFGDGSFPDGPLVGDCTGKPDGEVCGADVICVKEQCVASRCGDGFVDDAAGEQCEDTSDVPGDGCGFCQWDCTKNADCDDGNICNGQEGCKQDTHECKAGAALPDGIACTQLNGDAGVCSRKQCVAKGCGNGITEGKEDCDDKNDTPNDGCEGDCTFSCQGDADCDDGELCTGVERCDKSDPTKPVCKAGEAVDCTSTLCDGVCDRTTGTCIFEDGDRDGATCDTDCNDKDPGVFPSAPECRDNKDNDCNPATADGKDGECACYKDGDKDGFAAAKTPPTAMVGCQEGFTATAPTSGKTDCHDGRVDVHPAQNKFFTDSYRPARTTKPNLARQSWDYNCDGTWQKLYSKLYTKCANGSLKFKCSGSGWKGSVPNCGVVGDYVSCERSFSVLSCTPRTKKLIQACR